MGWIIDSGASQHLCGDEQAFFNYQKVSGEQGITIADGTKIQAKGIGEITVATEAGSITLKEVWHVPDIGGNLRSVSRMLEAGYSVEFGPTTCTIRKDGVRTKLGERQGRLYHLVPRLTKQAKEDPLVANIGLTTNHSPRASMEIWHRRLCHRTLDHTSVNYISTRVRDMEVSDAGKESKTICGICAMGRQHKEAGTGVQNKVEQILEVVHSDLCGPMQTVGLTGERYFITFINQASGRVSPSLLRTKDEALTAFQVYRARAEKSSGKEIKSFRSDGGGEYLNKKFKDYLQEAGIHHIVSPPYSPAQNGRAERANRTIMENARCILEDSKLGKEFWGQAVLTSAQIHNRLPSRSHKDMSPIEYWTGKPPGVEH